MGTVGGGTGGSAPPMYPQRQVQEVFISREKLPSKSLHAVLRESEGNLHHSLHLIPGCSWSGRAGWEWHTLPQTWEGMH